MGALNRLLLCYTDRVLSSETIVLNDYSSFQKRTKESASGATKAKVTVEIKSEPILVEFDEMKLGKGPAEAIAALLKRQVMAIGEFAAPSTRLFRQRAGEAFAAGKRWATKRYSGGRIGAMPPNQTPRLFNDSGRLAQSIFATENKTDKSWTVNVAANRFDASAFRGGTFEAMLRRLQELAPAFKGGAEVAGDESVRAAIRESVRDMIVVANDRLSAARAQAVSRVLGSAWRNLIKPIAL